jgi:signal transduction histidine kinase
MNLQLFIDHEYFLLSERRMESQKSNSVLIWLILIGFTFSLLVGILSITLLSPNIIKGLNKLIGGLKLVSEDKLEAKLDETRSDELGLLAKNFNIMTTNLEDSKSKILMANEAKGQFLANMSHEIRTPMNGILGMIQLMSEKELSADQRDMVETTRSCGDGLLTILNDILYLSKIEFGKLSLEISNFNMKKCIDESFYVSSYKASQQGVNLILKNPSTDDLWFKGYITRIRQILVNYISNAVKFTEKGNVEIFLDENKIDDQVSMVTVRGGDSGIGINKQKLDKLFTPFSGRLINNKKVWRDRAWSFNMFNAC